MRFATRLLWILYVSSLRNNLNLIGLSQFHWTYISNTNKPYRVVLYHGNKSGHVLIHCNAKIMIIDFSVLQTKTYSFFIENELCEIVMERKGNRFFYDFEINREVDTPLNRARNKLEKKHWRQSLLFFGGMLLLVALFTFSFLSFKSSQARSSLNQLNLTNFESTTARLVVEPRKENTYLINFSFVANGKKVEGQLEQEGYPLYKNSFPLETGDELAVKYASSHPKVHELNFEQAPEKQINRFLNRTLQKHQQYNSSITKEMANCQLNIAYQLKGIAGLALFYFQKKTPEENARFNQQTYQRLVRDIPFKNEVQEKCW